MTALRKSALALLADRLAARALARGLTDPLARAQDMAGELAQLSHGNSRALLRALRQVEFQGFGWMDPTLSRRATSALRLAFVQVVEAEGKVPVRVVSHTAAEDCLPQLSESA